MAEYTKIERDFWESDEARDMTPEEKYFWFYLQTNANVNTLGCYTFRMRRAMDETGYNQETIEKLLQRMADLKRILWDKATGEVCLLHFADLYWNKKTATLRAIHSGLKDVKSPKLKDFLLGVLAGKEIITDPALEQTVMQYRKEPTDTTENNAEHLGTLGNNRGEEEEEEEEKEKKKKEKRDRHAFTPPTLQEVEDYCRERRNRVDGQRFIDFYKAKGWMIGKNKMKDWKAAVRTWERQDAERAQGQMVVRQQGASAENNDALASRRGLMGN